MAQPSTIARAFLLSRLCPGGSIAPALAALGVAGVHRGQIPAGQPWTVDGQPVSHILFAEQAPGADQYVIGPRRLLSDPLYQVAAVGRVADPADLDAVATAIDALLHDAAGAVAGGVVAACSRERPLCLGPITGPASVTTCKLGGLYRLIVREEE